MVRQPNNPGGEEVSWTSVHHGCCMWTPTHRGHCRNRRDFHLGLWRVRIRRVHHLRHFTHSRFVSAVHAFVLSIGGVVVLGCSYCCMLMFNEINTFSCISLWLLLHNRIDGVCVHTNIGMAVWVTIPTKTSCFPDRCCISSQQIPTLGVLRRWRWGDSPTTQSRAVRSESKHWLLLCIACILHNVFGTLP